MDILTLTASVNPAMGNTESSVYVAVLIIAGILIIAAVTAGIISKKRKK